MHAASRIPGGAKSLGGLLDAAGDAGQPRGARVDGAPGAGSDQALPFAAMLATRLTGASKRPASTGPEAEDDTTDADVEPQDAGAAGAEGATPGISAGTAFGAVPMPLPASAAPAVSAMPAASTASNGNVRHVSRDADALVPALRERLGRVVDRMRREYGHDVRIAEAGRTQARQDYLYAQGRTRPGAVVTWTRNSAHTQGRAVDVTIDGGYDNAAAFATLQQVAQSEGLRTLGARDPGHLELPRSVPGSTLGLDGDDADARVTVESFGVRTEPATPALPPAPVRVAVPGEVAQVAPVASVAPIAQIAPVAEVARVADVATATPGATTPTAVSPAVASVAPWSGTSGTPTPVAPPQHAKRVAPERAPSAAGRDALTAQRPSMAVRDGNSARPAQNGATRSPARNATDAAATRATTPVANAASSDAVPATLRTRDRADTSTTRDEHAPPRDDEPSSTREVDHARGPHATPAGESTQVATSTPDTPMPIATTRSTPSAGAMAPSAPAAPVLGAVAAERIARVLDAQQAAAPRTVSHLTLRVERADGTDDRIRLDLRGRSVDARIDVADLGAADHLAARTPELRAALARHGLVSDEVRVRAATDPVGTARSAADAGSTDMSIERDASGAVGRRDAAPLLASASGDGIGIAGGASTHASSDTTRDQSSGSRDTARDDARGQRSSDAGGGNTGRSSDGTPERGSDGRRQQRRPDPDAFLDDQLARAGRRSTR